MLENLAASNKYGAEPKPKTMETSLLHTNVCDDVNFVMMIKTVDTSFLGDPQGAKKHGFRGCFMVQATFPPVSTHQTHHICRKYAFRFFATSHQISSQHFNRKILFLNKIKISTRWPSRFQALFLTITSQPHSLAAFPRSAKLPNSSLNISSHSGPLQRHCGVLWTPNCDLEVNFLNPHIWTLTHIPQKTAQIDFFRKDPVFENAGGRRSAKTVSDGLDGVRAVLFAFTLNFATISVGQMHEYRFFSKRSNVKVCFCHSHSILCYLVDTRIFPLAF